MLSDLTADAVPHELGREGGLGTPNELSFLSNLAPHSALVKRAQRAKH
jgi:hypothetical protein